MRCGYILLENIITLHVTTVYIYNNLGTLLELPKERDIEFTESRISSARRCVGGFLAIGSTHAPVSLISSARVYNYVSLSRILYGLEVFQVSNSALRSLEDVHCDIGK